NTKGGTWYVFSKPFRKHGIVPLATYMDIYKKDDNADTKGIVVPNKCYHGKTGTVYNVTQHTAGTVLNKQVNNKIPGKRINVQIRTIKHLRKMIIRKPKRKDPSSIPGIKKKKRYLGSTEAPACPGQRTTLLRIHGKEPKLQEPVPYEFMA
ncbi:60S ribosomal protein L21, partial [Heterocephalus glaber]